MIDRIAATGWRKGTQGIEPKTYDWRASDGTQN